MTPEEHAKRFENCTYDRLGQLWDNETGEYVEWNGTRMPTAPRPMQGRAWDGERWVWAWSPGFEGGVKHGYFDHELKGIGGTDGPGRWVFPWDEAYDVTRDPTAT